VTLPLEDGALGGVLDDREEANEFTRGRGLDTPMPFELDLALLDKLPQHEREEELAKLAAFQAGVTANPLWRILPHQGELGYRKANGLPILGKESRGQVEFLELDRMGVYLGAIVAGNRFGKTFSAVLRALIQTLPWEFIPPWMAPYKVLDPEKRDVRIMFAGKDSSNWLPKVFLPKLHGRQALVPTAALHGGSWRTAWHSKERTLTFADGSKWWVVTYDMDTQSWAGSDVDSVSLDEEPVGEDGRQKYEEAVGRTIDREGDIRITMTPVEGIGWLADELTDEHDEPRQDDEVWVVGGDIDHNPHISDIGRQRAIKRWQNNPTTEQARRRGLWVHREGLIFPEFRRVAEVPPGSEMTGGHLRSPRPLRAPKGDEDGSYPRDQHGRWRVPVFESVDPGINVDHPFAYSIAFLNNQATDIYGQDDVLEVFYAFKAPDLNIDQQCDVIKEVRLEFGIRAQFSVVDPAANNRNVETGRKLIDAYRKRDVFLVPGQNDRGLTYGELRSRIVGHRYRIWSTLDPLLGDEFAHYRWKRAKGRTEDAPRPEPIKRNDDLIDTQRYMVVRIPVWRGDPVEHIEDDDPRRALLKASIKRLSGKNRRRARTGGVW
jgi:hypothetical protein